MIKILKKDQTYRREQEYTEISFWNCTKITTQDPSWSWRTTMIQRYGILLVSEGCVEVTLVRKTRVRLDSNSVLLISPNTPLEIRETGESSTLWLITFSCDDFLFFPIEKKHLHVKVSSSTVSLFYQLSSHLVHDSKPHYFYESLLVLILDEIKRHIIVEPEKREIYDKVCKYISEHIHEDLTVQKISDAMNYHPDYLSKIIRDCNHSNVQKLIIEEKLETSKNLLRMTRFSCEKIAHHVGIESGNKFVKFFKYHTRQTPSEYRNIYQIYV